MSGRGMGCQGILSRGVGRQRKILKGSIYGISKTSIRRLARRGGVMRLSNLVHEEARRLLKIFLEKVIRDALVYMEHAHRRTVTAMDIVYALKHQGRTLYGFDG